VERVEELRLSSLVVVVVVMAEGTSQAQMMTVSAALPSDVRKVSEFPTILLITQGYAPSARAQPPENFSSTFRWGGAATAHQTAWPLCSSPAGGLSAAYKLPQFRAAAEF
jgi:hypothetical protein